MSFDVKVKINVLNQLRLLRNSTFKDKLSFLDEIIQNAQRAKAKNVWVTYRDYSETMTIENDGGILKDPQVLFSMSDSGWEKDVMETENPFGVGFFSVITVSDYVEIFTGNTRIVFDVAKMLQTNCTDIIVEETDNTYDGFKLILHNFKAEGIYYTDIQERVSLLGKYIHELDIYMNNNLQDKKNLTDGDNSVFQIIVEEDSLFKGWLAFQSGWSTEGINIFYKGRFVTKLENMAYLKGDLHVTDKALNLQAPDRKDIIRDKKYQDFLKTVTTYAQMLCDEALTNGKQKDIDEFANVLSRYSDKELMKKKIKFTIFKGNDKNDIGYLKGIAKILKENKKEEISSLSEYEVYLRKDAAEQKEEVESDEITFVEVIKSTAPEAKGVIYHEASSSSSSSESEAYTERPEITEDEVEERVGEYIFEEEQPTFWMNFKDIEKFEKNLNIIKHYGLKLIIARNKFEEELLKSMINMNVLYIDVLKENIRMEATLSNIKLSLKEQRALMLLDMLSRMAGFAENVFVIGDLMVLKTTEIESLNKKFESIEDKVVSMYNLLQNKVYVDRVIIETSMLEESIDENLTLIDYKFLLANLSVLIEQIMMLDFKEKSKNNLYEKTLMALAIA